MAQPGIGGGAGGGGGGGAAAAGAGEATAAAASGEEAGAGEAGNSPSYSLLLQLLHLLSRNDRAGPQVAPHTGQEKTAEVH